MEKRKEDKGGIKRIGYIKPVRAFICSRCGHDWIPRQKEYREIDNKKAPIACPKCNSPYWKESRKNPPENNSNE
jgi:DNA-directed RNA polymerase subunit RPC12/RpoP|tara:strand:- start:737 stop:958 length:222 start_codon:yes stop_codon:yes gene_type:complete